MDPIKKFQDADFGLCQVLYEKSIQSKDVCFFASYSILPFLPDYVFYYLNEIKRAGIAIIFISSSEINKNDYNTLLGIADIIVEKENKGTDFGAWCSVLRWLNFGYNLQTLYLCNDSVFGPFIPFDKIHAKFTQRTESILGITDSFQGEYHIQSYFVGIKNNVLKSPEWKKFWKEMSFLEDKIKVIECYELGLTKVLLNAGFNHFIWSNWSASTSFHTVVEKVCRNEIMRNNWLGRVLLKQEKILSDINPSSFLWKELISMYNSPFLKRELFILSHLYEEYETEQFWVDVVNKNSNYPISLIKQFQVQYLFYKSWKKSPFFSNLNISAQETCKEGMQNAGESSYQVFQSLKSLFYNTECEFPYTSSADFDSLKGTIHVLPLLISEENNSILHCPIIYIDKAFYKTTPTKQAELKKLIKKLPYLIIVVEDVATRHIVSHMLRLRTENLLLGTDFYSPTGSMLLVQLLKKLYDIYSSGAGQINLYVRPTLDLVIQDAVKKINTSNFCNPDPKSIPGDSLQISNEELNETDNVHKEFLRIKEKYTHLYERTPWWYKKTGQVIKLFTGNKRFVIKIVDKGRKLHYNPTPEDITHWYYLQYEILPKWYKQFGKYLIRKNSKHE